jgi:hypothetical protein
MPADEKKQPIKGGPRAPKGKKQMLVLLDQEVIKSVKMAALEDEIPMSRAVEEAIKDWLSKRKSKRISKASV